MIHLLEKQTCLADIICDVFYIAGVFLTFPVFLPADLSPGLAALTVGCDSGNLGSLSRVHLLLLDRQEPDTIPSPPGFEEELLSGETWPDLKMQNCYRLNSAGKLLKSNIILKLILRKLHEHSVIYNYE